MIAYECPKCGTAMESPDDGVAREERCPHCGAMVAVPEPNQGPYVGTTEDLLRWLYGFLWLVEWGLRATALIAAIALLCVVSDAGGLRECLNCVCGMLGCILAWMVADGAGRARVCVWNGRYRKPTESGELK